MAMGMGTARDTHSFTCAIAYSTSGHFWHQSDFCNLIPIYWEYLWILTSNYLEHIKNLISNYLEILLACFTLKHYAHFYLGYAQFWLSSKLVDIDYRNTQTWRVGWHSTWAEATVWNPSKTQLLAE